jgi:hypothetical protein
MTKMVWVSTRFVGFHRWKDAPNQVIYLRDWHRHEFHVQVGVAVQGSDREVEFLQLKDAVKSFVRGNYEGKYFEWSCEQLAERLMTAFGACFVEVSEDGENGATVWNLYSDTPVMP